MKVCVVAVSLMVQMTLYCMEDHLPVVRKNVIARLQDFELLCKKPPTEFNKYDIAPDVLVQFAQERTDVNSAIWQEFFSKIVTLKKSDDPQCYATLIQAMRSKVSGSLFSELKLMDRLIDLSIVQGSASLLAQKKKLSQEIQKLKQANIGLKAKVKARVKFNSGMIVGIAATLIGQVALEKAVEFGGWAVSLLG